SRLCQPVMKKSVCSPAARSTSRKGVRALFREGRRNGSGPFSPISAPGRPESPDRPAAKRIVTHQLNKKGLLMNAHRLSLLVPSVLAAAVVAGCMQSDAVEAPAEPPAPAVTTTEVLVREMADWADFTGRLQAAETVTVRPRVAGYIDAVHFEEGGRVEAGDLLFRIDPRPYQAEVDRLAAKRERPHAQGVGSR